MKKKKGYWTCGFISWLIHDVTVISKLIQKEIYWQFWSTLKSKIDISRKKDLKRICFNILKVQHFEDAIPKFEPCLKKSGDFTTPESCVILLSKWSTNRAAKMSGHVAWWRSVGDKTKRLQYDSACFSCTQHQYPCRRLKIQRKHSTQTRSICCFASEAVLCNQFRPQHHVTRWNCTISSSQSPDHFLTKTEQFSAPNLD